MLELHRSSHAFSSKDSVLICNFLKLFFKGFKARRRKFTKEVLFGEYNKRLTHAYFSTVTRELPIRYWITAAKKSINHKAFRLVAFCLFSS